MTGLGALGTGSAAAGAPSLKQLQKELRKTKRLRDRARVQARVVAADLAAAQALFAATAVAVHEEASPEEDAAGADPASALREGCATEVLNDHVVTEPEIDALKARSVAAKRRAQRLTRKVKNLQARIKRRRQINDWNRRCKWRPLIRIAAGKYGVSAGGLQRMMILESGGRRTAGTIYKGLFQYHPTTWKGGWNPWRRQSIYNGWAQIRATAYALKRGMGPRHWPRTYRMAF